MNATTIDPLAPQFGIDDCIRWAVQVRNVLGGAFHPETPFADYVRLCDDAPTFAPRESDRLDGELIRVDSYYPGGIYKLWEDAGRGAA